ncbi:MAG: alginate export family protein [Casimicrobiaceae bacterium]
MAAGTACAQFADVPRPATPDNAYDQATANPVQSHWAPRLLQGAEHAADRAPLAATDTTAGILQTGGLDAWPRLYRGGDLLITGSLTGTAAGFKMWNNEFGVPPSLQTHGYATNPGWGEFFLEPGLSATYKVSAQASVYGGFSYLEASTRGRDNAGSDNVWYGNRELLYAGAKWRDADSGFALDVSYGQQNFHVGNGMLLWSGASNGGQRGANYLGPRGAWATAGVVKGTWKEMAVQGFYLKPNDASADATGTTLVGVNFDWHGTGPLRVGAMYVHVPESDIVTRNGLNIYDLRARWHPVVASPRFWLDGEYVWERKASVAAEGWYVQANYNATDTTWKPLLALRYAALSGARSGSSRWQGFDPLYFGNGNPNWYQGKLGSTLFNNTNLNTASAALTVTPTEKQILQFWYLYFSADQANSPLDIPAAGQPVPTGGGVPNKPLASEFDVAYTYTFSKSVNVNVVAAYATPGSGYKQLYSANSGSANGWWLLGTQFNISY